MRLKTYLNEEWVGRTKRIMMGEMKELLSKNCKEALKNYKKKFCMYRGILHFSNDFGFYDGKPSNRKSAHADGWNFYMLILNNSKSWSKFPKREIVGTTDRYHAQHYGECYMVFPYDGAKIGICNNSDLWHSFGYWNNEFKGGSSLEYVNIILTGLFRRAKIKEPQTYKDVVEGCKKFDSLEEYQKSDILGYLDAWRLSNESLTMDTILEHGLLFWVLDRLDPDMNKIKLGKIGSMKNLPRQEVWTDSKCVFINANHQEEFENHWLKELL